MYKSVVNHSPYVDDVTFVFQLKNKKNCYTILSTNIASIRSKLNELQFFLKNLEDSEIILVLYVFKKVGCQSMTTRR